jgi:tripartite-type tricarboxylate transporter receptor subunit TctC
LSEETIKRQAGIPDLLIVPYKGAGPALSDLVGGQVNAAFLPLLAVKPHVDAGKVKVIAISSPQRSPLAPNLATFREQGYPELDIYIWSSIAAPAGTPDAVIARLNAEFVKALRSTEIRDKWTPVGFEPMPSTPEEASRFAQAESKRWAEAVKISGFKAAE